MATDIARGSLPRSAWAFIALGYFLHIARVPHRMVEGTWDYATYHLPLKVALSPQGEGLGALLSLQGLHPPLHALSLIPVEGSAPSFLAYLLPSALATATATLVMALAARSLGGGPGAIVTSALMALSPTLLLYGTEVLSYPLLVLGLSCLLLGAARWWGGHGVWMLALGVILAGYAHILGAVAGAGLTAWLMVRPRPRGDRLHPLKGAALLALYLPLLWGAAQALAGGEARQGTFHLGLWAQGAWARFGIGGLLECLLLGGGLYATRHQVASALPKVMVASVAIGYGASLLMGAAAGHQFPYMCAFIPPMALLGGLTLNLPTQAHQRRTLALVILALAIHGAFFMARQTQALASTPRDLHLPTVTYATLDKSALFLITNYQPDDDKTNPSPTLLSLGLSTPLPNGEPCDLDPFNHRFGQPRAYQGRTLRLFTRVAPGPMMQAIHCHHQRGEAVYLLPYGQSQALMPALEALRSPYEAYPLPTHPGAYILPAPAQAPEAPATSKASPPLEVQE